MIYVIDINTNMIYTYIIFKKYVHIDKEGGIHDFLSIIYQPLTVNNLSIAKVVQDNFTCKSNYIFWF